ncbi:MAG: hypothetical protein Unbinned2990contig1001_36 [Prokaryotic dsDNA virus sp.]|nr:MAG: hypothetical protein Unbinned2990contig1001_36 [Prokaryotic dsDNA virus sp.]|tara:strand:+ start:16103 stop:16372 length:270 start_codon:yes stop_codon:yes gene_type:complete
MSVVKVKPSENQDFKPFEVEIVEITWKKRCELNDMMIQSGQEGVGTFSFWGNICLKYTTLKENELNKYTTDEIVAIAQSIFEFANRKKK